MKKTSEPDSKEDQGVEVYPPKQSFRPLRAWGTILWQQSLTWSFNALFLGTVCLLTVLTLGWFAKHYSHFIMRTWGRTMLWICNVKLVVEPNDEGDQVRSRILTYNHSSTLDIFIITVVTPRDSFPIIKKELLKVPFIGWTCKAMGFVALDRSNREKSISSLNDAALDIKARNVSVTIAPEGTRNSRRRLKKFKLGAFKMAHHGQLPIVPMVFEGAASIMPPGQNYCCGGTVRVRFLPDYTPDRLNVDALVSNANELKSIYEGQLLEMMELRASQDRSKSRYPLAVE